MSNSEYSMAEALHAGDRDKIYQLMNKPGFNIDDIIEDSENSRLTPIQTLVYEVNLNGDKKHYMDVFLPVLTSFMGLNPSEENIQKAIEIVDDCLDEHSHPRFANNIHASLLKVKQILENESESENEDPQGGGRKRKGKGKKSRKSNKTRKSKSKKTRKSKSKKTRKSKSKKTRRH